MTVKISLRYDTFWGENLVLRIGGKCWPMKYCADGRWCIDFPKSHCEEGTEYSFELQRDGATVREEWQGHVLRLPGKPEGVVRVFERWNDRPADSPFYSSAFRDAIFRHDRAETPWKGTGNVTFAVTVPEVRRGQAVALAGSGKALGEWKKFHLLDEAHFPEWAITLNVREPFEFKFVIVDKKTGKPVLWESSENHFFKEIPPKGESFIIKDFVPAFRPEPWRGAGVAVPVFSLRTEDSFGIGEFNDIKKLADWAEMTGQSVIQLLPINDTSMTLTWADSYPYNAVSSFALHPQFIHLPALGVRADKAYREKKEALNALPKVDYEKVNSEKLAYLRKVYEKSGAEILASPACMKFIEGNKWLLPYAVYCCLRDEKGTSDFSKWGSYAKYSQRKAEGYAGEHQAEVGFWYFVQYELDLQLKEAVAYAHGKGVILKGDLPIGVSRLSADAWADPDLFNMDSQAGAPPDAFSADGQNWGFPTYNWDRMAETGYAWWKARLRKMGEYFDAFRIDHILGFFRIWEIPLEYKSGLMGHFSPALPYPADELRSKGFTDFTDIFIEDPRQKGWYHPRIAAQHTDGYARLNDWQKSVYNDLYNDFFYSRNNAFWKEQAMKKLPALLGSTGMLACGEDLGMIPACVPETMSSLGILSLEIQRMPKDVHVDFGDPSQYPYYCVCATGTHDTSPLRAWWEEDRELTQKFYNGMMHCGGEAPYFCEPWAAEIIVKDHLASPAMLCILPLQDYLAIDGDVRYQGDPADERINVPAIARHYWRYRMHCTIESLISNEAFSGHMHDLIAETGRGK
ncbi:MAG: 4-alpha-glucanotransferase [Bacteroidales bacterium]|nr:4-alpha-glucanotransferase [Bacteroidales bacterium]